MRTIKFTHNYKKLGDEKRADLVCVETIFLEEQTQSFLDYDAEGIYKLPERGRFILLVFLGEHGAVFTTIRRHTPQKYVWYNSGIGFTYNIEVIKNDH